jgi:hypothetical protein
MDRSSKAAIVAAAIPIPISFYLPNHSSTSSQPVPAVTQSTEPTAGYSQYVKDCYPKIKRATENLGLRTDRESDKTAMIVLCRIEEQQQ